MSIHIHLGQCGNQLGIDFWKLAHKTYGPVKPSAPLNPLSAYDGTCSALFHSNGASRAIWVDTEPKVVVQALREGYACKERVSYEQGGRGNNFAHGFTESMALCDDTLERVRLEIETLDYYRGAALWHSIGGGTGSGSGSKLCELLRDAYPRSHILTVSVTACRGSESPIFNYNSALALAALHENVDGTILLQNEELLKELQPDGCTIKRPDNLNISIASINELATTKLSGMLFPVHKIESSGSCQPRPIYQRAFDIGDLVASTCPSWNMKYLNIASSLSTPQISRGTRRSWNKTVGDFRHSIRPLDRDSNVIECFGSKIYVRFPRTEIRRMVSCRNAVKQSNKRSLENERSFLPSEAIIRRNLLKVYNYPPWYPETSQFHDILYSCELSRDTEDKSITACSNTTKCIPLMERLVWRGETMLRANAYVHWYAQFGLEKADFSEAFTSINGIIDTYRCHSLGASSLPKTY